MSELKATGGASVERPPYMLRARCARPTPSSGTGRRCLAQHSGDLHSASAKWVATDVCQYFLQ
eukprot:3149987-Alexandrium_andersonii.AAC.1